MRGIKMSSELDVISELELGHVLFIDVVGYSKLPSNEQREIQRQLSQIVRGTEYFRAAETAGKLIRLPVGDGMALVFFNSHDAPVRCALEISETVGLALKLRMGIHSGPVSTVTDVNDRSNVAGAGINIAQRVMDCGDAGHILLSKQNAEDLAQHSEWQPCLQELGEVEVKHGVRVALANFLATVSAIPSHPVRSFEQNRSGAEGFYSGFRPSCYFCSASQSALGSGRAAPL